MKTQDLKKELQKLKNFLDKNSFSDSELIKWVSSSVAFFSKIKMNEPIVAAFLNTFNPEKDGQKKDISSYSHRIGPFVRSFGEQKYVCKHDYFGVDSVDAKMVYIAVAFQTAETIIQNLEESERLVPKSLLGFFKIDSKYSQIFSSLELMEQNFENKDADGLAKNSLTLLESTLGLELALKGLDLSKQLKKLCANQVILDKFGIRKEIIYALDNSRLLRNQLGAHKDIPIEYDIPFAVALGIAYLVIMVLQITMATGILIV